MAQRIQKTDWSSHGVRASDKMYDANSYFKWGKKTELRLSHILLLITNFFCRDNISGMYEMERERGRLVYEKKLYDFIIICIYKKQMT